MSRVPHLPRLTAAEGGLKDAARRQGGGLAAVLDPAIRHCPEKLRSGRRNGPVPSNKETSLVMTPTLLHSLTDTTIRYISVEPQDITLGHVRTSGRIGRC